MNGNFSGNLIKRMYASSGTNKFIEFRMKVAETLLLMAIELRKSQVKLLQKISRFSSKLEWGRNANTLKIIFTHFFLISSELKVDSQHFRWYEDIPVNFHCLQKRKKRSKICVQFLPFYDFFNFHTRSILYRAPLSAAANPACERRKSVIQYFLACMKHKHTQIFHYYDEKYYARELYEFVVVVCGGWMRACGWIRSKWDREVQQGTSVPRSVCWGREECEGRMRTFFPCVLFHFCEFFTCPRRRSRKHILSIFIIARFEFNIFFSFFLLSCDTLRRFCA